MYDLITFGNTIRQIRKSFNFTQTEIYIQTGVSIETQRNLENGIRIVSIETLNKLSYVYKKDLLILLTRYRDVYDLLSEKGIDISLKLLKEYNYIEHRKYVKKLIDVTEQTFKGSGRNSVKPSVLLFLNALSDIDFINSRNKEVNIVSLKELLLNLSSDRMNILSDKNLFNVEISSCIMLSIMLRRSEQYSEANFYLNKIIDYYKTHEIFLIDDSKYYGSALINYCYVLHLMDEHELVISTIQNFFQDTSSYILHDQIIELQFRLGTSYFLLNKKTIAFEIYRTTLFITPTTKKKVYLQVLRDSYNISLDDLLYN